MTHSPATAWGRRLLCVAIASVALVLGSTPTAQAHATLLFTTPSVDGVVPSSPEQIQLVFDRPVTPTGTTLRVSGPGGSAVRLGQLGVGDTESALTAPVLQDLPTGQYAVDWTVTAADGDTMTGTFQFAVGSTAGLSLGGGSLGGGVQPAVEGAGLVLALRLGLFTGLALALGGLLGRRLARGSCPGGDLASDPQPWLRTGSLIGLLAASGLAITQAGGGSLAAGLDLSRLLALADSAPGIIAIATLAATTAATLALVGRRPGLAGVALLLVPLAEGVRAHPQSVMPGWGAALTFIHLTAVILWVGALIHVVRVALARRRRGLPPVAILLGYARVALWLFLLVALSGTIAALLLAVPAGLVQTLAHTTYGRWLLAKLALVGTVAALALYARWSLRRRHATPATTPTTAVRLEVTALIAVLAVSSLLTVLAPPVPTDQDLPFPPPPVGQLSAAGTRAGWIGIGASASSGQLLVRLNTPDSNDPTPPEYDLAANLTAPGEAKARRLRLRRCGPGCFVTTVDWRPGSSTITLKARSSTWTGGTAATTIAWPPTQASTLLRGVVTTMNRQPTLTLHEQVTSDTNAGPGLPTTLRLTGRDLLASGPYSSGGAPTVVLLDTDTSTGERDLQIAYPGAATYVRLTVDRSGRILRETLNAPNHLTTRTMIYDEDHPRP